jgi:dolichol-phosphate mannosyltransferase
MTSGFRCYRYEALKAIDLEQIRSNGYSFQIEMVHLVIMAGYQVCEMPIIFYERNFGSSKMTKNIVWEAMILPWKLRIKKVRDDFGKSTRNKKDVKEISV